MSAFVWTPELALVLASMSDPHGNPHEPPPAKAAASTFVWRCLAWTYLLPTETTIEP
ncbi:MAG: hypothetical protein H0U00_09860 [Actinobacteria bacterium]|nr:hypothetical protein [Actinomycetota bacterium]